MVFPTLIRCENMTEFIKVATVAEIPPGTRLHYDFDEESVIVLNIDGEFYCIADLCTHDGGPLEDGDLIDHQIVCPRHGACFDVRTGKVTRLPATDSIPTFQVRIENGEVLVQEPEPW
jgi:3-phenylpropionate/trans-cinnamate dioxygenase ferredoxin component